MGMVKEEKVDKGEEDPFDRALSFSEKQNNQCMDQKEKRERSSSHTSYKSFNDHYRFVCSFTPPFRLGRCSRHIFRHQNSPSWTQPLSLKDSKDTTKIKTQTRANFDTQTSPRMRNSPHPACRAAATAQTKTITITRTSGDSRYWFTVHRHSH